MTITVSSKGQIVIPQTFRQKLGIQPGDRLVAEVVDDALVLRLIGKPSGTARIVTSALSGLPAIEPPPGAPVLTTAQVKAILANFP